MNPPRHSRIYNYPAIDAAGRKTCRWCGGERPKGTRFYCSFECSDEGAIRASGSFARHKVLQRDDAVCARCGNRGAWEMNHIIPVSEGGGSCGLDNLETLCMACHGTESARQAAKRAEERKTTAFERKSLIVDEALHPSPQLDLWP